MRPSVIAVECMGGPIDPRMSKEKAFPLFTRTQTPDISFSQA